MNRGYKTSVRLWKSSGNFRSMGETSIGHQEDVEGNSGRQGCFQRSAANYTSRSGRNTKESVSSINVITTINVIPTIKVIKINQKCNNF